MTIRGGSNPHTAMATMPLGEWTRRLGALPVEAYDCFMVGTLYGLNRIQAWFAGSRAIARGQWQAPLGSSCGNQPNHGQPAAVLASVKDKPFGGAEEAPSLTLAVRDGDGDMRSGRKNARGAESNKRIK